jgi:V8-like Glu-specific endopeptidase
MRRAEPIDVPESWGSGGSASPSSSGPASWTEASPPTAARRWSEATGEGEAPPIPYTRTEITDPAAFPYRTNGRLFGVDAFGEEYSCSATAVSSQNHSVVMTAGHCVFLEETGGWARALLFVPGYLNGSAPYGEWPAPEMLAPPGWLQLQTPSYDVAALVTSPNPDGVRLEELVGGRGIAWNVARKLQFDSFGYPAAPPFDGERLYVCDSQTGIEAVITPKPRPTAIGCDMNEGSSGGGWIIRDTYLNGVNSFGLVGLDDVMFGPYFGDAAATLYQQASVSTTPGSLPTEPPPAPLVGQIHAMALSLRLSGHLVARGKMTVPDGYIECSRDAPVLIFHKVQGGWDLAKRARTGSNGTFNVRLRDRAGKYHALAPEGSVDDLNVCAEARSRGAGHR